LAARQSKAARKVLRTWIASSQALLAMTVKAARSHERDAGYTNRL
jgi:hypothetical protein